MNKEQKEQAYSGIGMLLSLVLIIAAGYKLGLDFGFSVGFAFIVGTIVCAKL